MTSGIFDDILVKHFALQALPHSPKGSGKSVKNLYLIPLFDIYGDMLTDTQKNIFDLYYNEDLSLGEISENIGISRQGVRDNIKRSEEILVNLENKLGFLKKSDDLSEKIENIGNMLKNGDIKNAIDELNNIKI